jgi:hypothetical protein
MRDIRPSSLFLFRSADDNLIIVNHRDLHMLDRPVAKGIKERDEGHSQDGNEFLDNGVCSGKELEDIWMEEILSSSAEQTVLVWLFLHWFVDFPQELPE